MMKRSLFAGLVLALSSAICMAELQSPLPQTVGTITTQNLTPSSANTVGSAVCADVSAAGAVTVQTQGTYTGALSATVSNDGLTRVTMAGTSTFLRLSNAATSATIGSGVQDVFQVGAITGVRTFCITALGAVTGSVTVTLQPAVTAAAGSTSITGGGDATAANQVTGNTSLASIDTKTSTTNTALGAPSDTVCATDTGACAAIPLLKKVASNLSASNTQLPADGTGQVTMANSFPVTMASDQSAQATAGQGATGAAVPSGATQIGVRTGANMEAVTQGATTVAISVSTATTTQLVALSGSTLIRVSSLSVIAGGTGNITFVYGTGASCGTGTTSLTGAYPLVANSGLTLGGGLGPVLVVPSGQALCVTTSAAVQMSGHVTYAQY